MRPARPRGALGFFLPGAIRHWRRISPHLAFDRTDGAVVAVRLRGAPWIETGNLRDAVTAPERLVIVGSGPTIRDMDLAALPSRTCVLLNGAISLMPAVRPFALVIEDRRFVDRHWDELRAKLPGVPVLVASGEVLSAIAERAPDLLVGADAPTVLFNDNLAKPVGQRRRDKDVRTNFSLAPHTGSKRGGSVAVTAMQWAVHWRAETIGFAGVELWNANAPRFYERDGDVARSGIVRAQARILEHIAAGRDEAARRGTNVVNHSPGSALAEIGIPFAPL